MSTDATPQWSVFSATCPSRESLARIANKWTAMVVILLAESPRRFGELHEEIGGISKKVLVDTLRALERDGMVAHSRDSRLYSLTDLGSTLEQPLRALQIWAEAHVGQVIDARDRYDAIRDDEILGDRPA